MRYCLNYSGIRFLSTENWNYSISWWNSSYVFVIKGENLPLVPTIPSLWIIRLWWYSLTLITPLLSGVFVNKLLSAKTTTVGMLLTSSSRKALVYMYCYKVKENIHYKHIVSQSLLNQLYPQAAYVQRDLESVSQKSWYYCQAQKTAVF